MKDENVKSTANSQSVAEFKDQTVSFSQLVQNSELDEQTKIQLQKQPSIGDWLVSPSAARAISRGRKAMIKNAIDGKVVAFRMQRDFMEASLREHLNIVLKGASAKGNTKLTQYLMELINDLQEETVLHEQKFLSTFKNRLALLEQNASNGIIYERYKQYLDDEFVKSLDFLTNMFNQVRQSIDKQLPN